MDQAEIWRALWNPAKPDKRVIDDIERQLRHIEPEISSSHQGAGQVSGCRWTLYVDKDGNGRGPRPGGWPDGAVAMWEVAFSFRGPFITALSWRDPRFPADSVTCPQLVSLVQKIAHDLGLNYLDAHEMDAWEIPSNELQGDSEMRLDFSDTATAFNLLFYEH